VPPEPTRAPGSIVGLDHVQIAIPGGGEDAARRFYGDLLGLAEVAKPAPLAVRGGCWFVGAGVAVHLGAEADFRPARKAHVALLVDDLDGLRRSLDAAGVTIRDDDPPIGVRRFYADDPFGSRLELVDRRDGGFTDRAERMGSRVDARRDRLPR
jgi:catechol 2,3-dioxygenase-like lactoylglutathione lyase family enzyme